MRCRARTFAVSIVLLSLALLLSGQSPTLAEGNRKAQNAVGIPNCDRSQFRLFVDVGHTAEAFGATSARNMPEYDFNLGLATEIDQSLVNAGFTKTVLLITHGPKMSSLLERVTVANQISGNLFLSIHHDSVPDAFLQDWQYDGRASHFSDRFAGYSLFASYENHYVDASIVFGKRLGAQLKDRGLQYDNHYTKEFMGRYQHQLVNANVGLYRYDKLVVLRETKMPAILLEAGSIINRNEEILMNSPEHRALISSAMTSAVEKFCEARSF